MGGLMHEETHHDPDAERRAREAELERDEDEHEGDEAPAEEGDADSAVEEPDEARDPSLEPGT
jgi:hypothetical protein